MSNGITTFLMIALMTLLMIILFQYSQTTIASTDIGVNLSGTAYNDTYHAQIQTTKTTLNFMAFMPYFLAIAGLVAVLFLVVPNKGHIGL